MHLCARVRFKAQAASMGEYWTLSLMDNVMRPNLIQSLYTPDQFPFLEYCYMPWYLQFPHTLNHLNKAQPCLLCRSYPVPWLWSSSRTFESSQALWLAHSRYEVQSELILFMWSLFLASVRLDFVLGGFFWSWREILSFLRFIPFSISFCQCTRSNKSDIT